MKAQIIIGTVKKHKGTDADFGQRLVNGKTDEPICSLSRKDINAAIDALGSNLGDAVVLPRKRYEITAVRLPRGITITWSPAQ